MKLIERRAAFEMLKEIRNEVEDGYGFQFAKWLEWLEKLPVRRDYCYDCPGYKAFFDDADGQTDAEILGVIRSMYSCFDEDERRVYRALSHAIDALEKMPTIERKTGKWIDACIPNDNGGLFVIVCDQCKTFFPLQFGASHNFCPNCGAKMKGEENEADRC